MTTTQEQTTATPSWLDVDAIVNPETQASVKFLTEYIERELVKKFGLLQFIDQLHQVSRDHSRQMHEAGCGDYSLNDSPAVSDMVDSATGMERLREYAHVVSRLFEAAVDRLERPVDSIHRNEFTETLGIGPEVVGPSKARQGALKL